MCLFWGNYTLLICKNRVLERKKEERKKLRAPESLKKEEEKSMKKGKPDYIRGKIYGFSDALMQEV